jgi:crotonobetainyl-CoA:carnitine CoA-transferase CaiB-like acyl-CoA transferase
LDTNAKRCHARDAFLPIIRDLFRTIPSEELMAKCERSGLPYAPIRRPEDLFNDPHLKQSGGLLDITLPNGTETQIPALPISVGGWRSGVRRDIPRNGQHSQELAQELGLSSDEIDALKQSGTVSFSD